MNTPLFVFALTMYCLEFFQKNQYYFSLTMHWPLFWPNIMYWPCIFISMSLIFRLNVVKTHEYWSVAVNDVSVDQSQGAVKERKVKVVLHSGHFDHATTTCAKIKTAKRAHCFHTYFTIITNCKCWLFNLWHLDKQQRRKDKYIWL